MTKPTTNKDNSLNMDIASNLTKVKERINKACQRSQRSTNDVLLVAVSKTKPLAMVMQAYQQGQRHFGENYLQDALGKIKQAQAPDIVWHFIGAIQSNKTKIIAENFAWVHTLERGKIAQRLNDQRPNHLPPLKICIQININQEANKSGISLQRLPALAEEVSQLPRLQLMGLMCIPAAQQPEATQQQTFRAMVSASLQLQKSYPRATECSMGMSEDLELAIAEGTTIVRIGTDIFGQREAKA